MVMDQDGKNIKLDEAEIINMGSLRRILDLVFSLRVRKSCSAD